MDHESPTPDVIELEMEATRTALTEKVAALEDQVVGTLQNATETVHSTIQTIQSSVETVKTAVEDTVGTVKESVQESVQAVTAQVKSTFDISSRVRDNPWAMVGGAAAVGFLTGLLVPGGGRRELFGHRPLGFQPGPEVPTPPSPTQAAEPPRPKPATPEPPSWLDELLGMAGREVRKLGEEALTLAVASARQSLQEQMPQLVHAGVATLVHRTHGNATV